MNNTEDSTHTFDSHIASLNQIICNKDAAIEALQKTVAEQQQLIFRLQQQLYQAESGVFQEEPKPYVKIVQGHSSDTEYGRSSESPQQDDACSSDTSLPRDQSYREQSLVNLTVYDPSKTSSGQEGGDVSIFHPPTTQIPSTEVPEESNTPGPAHSDSMDHDDMVNTPGRDARDDGSEFKEQAPTSVDLYKNKLTFDTEQAFTLGVCCMDKKARSRHMKEILRRIEEHGDIRVVIFGDIVIKEKPITEWPLCDVLLSFFSDGFPLEKAIQYVKLRNPFQINDLEGQVDLFRRDTIYQKLSAHSIPIPVYAVVYRNEYGEPDPYCIPIDHGDFLIIGQQIIHKPCMEKPLYSENHDIWLHYPASHGGGVRKLFRKIGNMSSQFDRTVTTIREDQSYVYEEFLQVDRDMDVKAYAVLPNYIHCELRKTPTKDGIVERDSQKKEIRHITPTTEEERRYAQLIGRVFKQRVCGFDFLRVTEPQSKKTRSLVCDVNGWSFVKGDPNYYESVARIIRNLILQVKARLKQSQDLSITDADRKDATLMKTITLLQFAENEPKHKQKVVVSSRTFPQVVKFFRQLSERVASTDSPYSSSVVDPTQPHWSFKMKDNDAKPFPSIITLNSPHTTSEEISHRRTGFYISIKNEPGVFLQIVEVLKEDLAMYENEDNIPNDESVPSSTSPALEDSDEEGDALRGANEISSSSRATIMMLQTLVPVIENKSRGLKVEVRTAHLNKKGKIKTLFRGPNKHSHRSREFAEKHEFTRTRSSSVTSETGTVAASASEDDRDEYVLVTVSWGGTISHAGFKTAQTIGKMMRSFYLDGTKREEDGEGATGLGLGSANERGQQFINNSHIHTGFKRRSQVTSIAFCESFFTGEYGSDPKLMELDNPNKLMMGRETKWPGSATVVVGDALLQPSQSEKARMQQLNTGTILRNVLIVDRKYGDFESEDYENPVIAVLLSSGLKKLGNPQQRLKNIDSELKKVTSTLELICEDQRKKKDLAKLEEMSSPPITHIQQQDSNIILVTPRHDINTSNETSSLVSTPRSPLYPQTPFSQSSPGQAAPITDFTMLPIKQFQIPQQSPSNTRPIPPKSFIPPPSSPVPFDTSHLISRNASSFTITRPHDEHSYVPAMSKTPTHTHPSFSSMEPPQTNTDIRNVGSFVQTAANTPLTTSSSIPRSKSFAVSSSKSHHSSSINKPPSPPSKKHSIKATHPQVTVEKGCGGEALQLIKKRYKTLARSLRLAHGQWNTNAVIAIYQNLKWDITHNPFLRKILSPLFTLVAPLAQFMCGLSYGILRKERLVTSSHFAGKLIEWIADEFLKTTPDSKPESHFLFVEDSQLMCTIDQMILSNIPGLHSDSLSSFGEVNYSSFVMFKIYSNTAGKIWCEVNLSTGLSDNPFQDVGPSHCLPLNAPVVLHEGFSKHDASEKLLSLVQKPTQKETLKGIFGVFRHGDRKPKQKMKMKVENEKLVNAFFPSDEKAMQIGPGVRLEECHTLHSLECTKKNFDETVAQLRGKMVEMGIADDVNKISPDIVQWPKNILLKQEFKSEEFEHIINIVGEIIQDMQQEGHGKKTGSVLSLKQKQTDVYEAMLNLHSVLDKNYVGTKVQVKPTKVEVRLVRVSFPGHNMRLGMTSINHRQRYSIHTIPLTRMRGPQPVVPRLSYPYEAEDRVVSPNSTVVHSPLFSDVRRTSLPPGQVMESSPISNNAFVFDQGLSMETPTVAMLVFVKEAQLIVKWGGSLTHAGYHQAHSLGHLFNHAVLPEDKAEANLFLENLHVYTNGERRVERTARAFTESLFGSDAHDPADLTYSSDLLDTISDEAREMLLRTKERMSKIMLCNYDFSLPLPPSARLALSQVTDQVNQNDREISKLRLLEDAMHLVESRVEVVRQQNPDLTEHGHFEATMELTAATSQEKRSHTYKLSIPFELSTHFNFTGSLIPDVLRSYPWGLKKLGNPLARLIKLDKGIRTLCEHLSKTVEKFDPTQFYVPMCEHETFRSLLHRWQKVSVDLHDTDTDTWDVTKIGDIYDCLRFDVLHMKTILETLSVPMEELISNCRSLADFWVTQEFGVSRTDKQSLGASIAGPLFKDIITSIEQAAFESGPQMKLYFTSESHIHGLLNLLMLSGVDGFLMDREEIGDLDYLTHFLFKVYEADASKEYRIELYLSSGAINTNPKLDVGQSHALPIEPPFLLNETLSLNDLRSILSFN
ncbi:putative Inositol hexakisphosphate and diphosphoinositol-pentakisphosphate kinase [Blattamonas nauphoetae]|uniref:diphosphoinositol-pentakisphosphate 1-kinase n=1 Tax=Blattamonas nauphoetae TaxID=2049346 RepID=A0ABQ9XFE9_9EUKA|nr:putative Inositol hexakisphosphate and diphosphoinositol-pentakisphosphate kinase [Blattamonas nauphoetae]